MDHHALESIRDRLDSDWEGCFIVGIRDTWKLTLVSRLIGWNLGYYFDLYGYEGVRGEILTVEGELELCLG